MPNQLSSGTILLLIVPLVAFIPVLHSSKTAKNGAPSMGHRYSKATSKKGVESESRSHPSLDTKNLIDRLQTDKLSTEEWEGSLLIAEPTIETDRSKNDYRFYMKQRTGDSKAQRRHYNRRMVRNNSKKHFEKGNKKNGHIQTIKEFENIKPRFPQKLTALTQPETVSPTVESSPDVTLSNASDDIDFHLSEMYNSSLNNESVSSNFSDSEKSKYSKCPTCLMREGEKQYRIERLKQTILSSLRMTAPPNASNQPIPKLPPMRQYQIEDNNMMTESKYPKRNNIDDDFAFETERVFTKAKEPPAKFLLNITQSVYFPLPPKLFTSNIKTTHLWIYIRKAVTQRPYINLRIERILPESHAENRLITRNVLNIRLQTSKAAGWKRIDVRNILAIWVKHPTSNQGLQIRAEDDHGNNLVVLPPYPTIDRGYEPWLDTTVQEHKSIMRRRRSTALRCNEDSTESRCCRYPLFITFGELGWDWIIAPSRVEADYCSGECLLTFQGRSPYSWIQQNLGSGSTNDCCTPSKLAPMPLLYFGEDYNVYHQILQDMKVLECGCV